MKLFILLIGQILSLSAMAAAAENQGLSPKLSPEPNNPQQNKIKNPEDFFGSALIAVCSESIYFPGGRVEKGESS